MTIKERYKSVLSWFETHQPDAQTELHYRNPYELLVAVILSAQCTDKRVNGVTPALFASYPDPTFLAKAKIEDVFQHIKSISYPNNKAKHLVAMAHLLITDFGGEVPANIDDLQKLPGVGRKTANVIVSVVFNQPAMAVDTHVQRVARRIGLVANAKTPLAVERQLVRHIPPQQIHIAHHWLILHGRYVCLARKPQCQNCPITTYCKYHQQTQSKLNLKWKNSA